MGETEIILKFIGFCFLLFVFGFLFVFLKSVGSLGNRGGCLCLLFVDFF